MKSAQLIDIRQMAISNVPEPRIVDPTDVLLKIETVGVCGSDVHYYTTGRIGSQIVEFPYAVGHEAAATVQAVGPGVTKVSPGDRVAIEPGVPCHLCDQCLGGRPHTCRNLKYLACPGQIEGCLSELYVMPEECCFPVPDHVSLEDAALVEPLSIGIYAVMQSIPMENAKIGILGMGPIGLSVMLPALAWGATAIYATDRLDYRCAMAREHGATWAGNPDTDDIISDVQDREPLLLDAVFECCGQQEALDQAFQLLKPGGKLMLIGIPEFDRYTFSAETGRRREICLQNVRRQNGCVQTALDLVADGKINPNFMVTHRFSLDDTKKAFDLVDGYADGVVKAMVHI